MKSRVLKLALCIIIFFSLIIASFALVRPIYIGLGNAMKSKINVLNDTLDKSFGVSVSYSSLSPSILTGINIKGIVVTDTATGETVLTIKKVKAEYSIRNILKGDFDNGFSKVVIRDLYAELIQGKNTAWLNYTITRKNEEKKNKELLESETELSKEIEKPSLMDILTDPDFEINIPFDVYINNCTVVYRDDPKRIAGRAELRKCFLDRTSTKNKYDLTFTGNVSGNLHSNRFSSSMMIQSSLLSKLNNSSAVINIYNANYNNYTVRQVGFLSEYEDSVFVFKMLPTIQNIYTEFTADLKKHDIKVRFDTNNFRLDRIVEGIEKDTLAGRISSLILSVAAKVNYNTESKALSYSGSGDIVLPENTMGSDLILSFAMNGNKSFVNIPYVKANGENVDVNFSGSYKINSMQPEGILSVNKLKLENDSEISCEMYFDPLNKGFMAFSPEVILGDKTFTAAQLNFIPDHDGFDITFDVYDYSHIEKGDTGYLRIDGNYSTNSRFFQSNVILEGMYVDSLLNTVAVFLGKNESALVKDFSPVFKNTIFSTSAYISSLDGNFSYSVPSVIIADTKSDSKMLMLSFDGNKENLQLSRFEFIFNDQRILATAHAESMYEKGNPQTILSGQIEYNSIPYAFSGLLNRDWISITGDYGFNFSLISDKDTDSLIGSFDLSDFPVKLESSTLSIATDTTFSYNAGDKLNLNVSKFFIQSYDGISDNNPSFAFTGNLDQQGAFLHTIEYKDAVSNLTGNGAVIWNFENADFISANYDISLTEPIYNEYVTLKGDITNPEKVPFTAKNFLSDYYITTEIDLKDFRTGRFTGDSLSSDTMNAHLNITGALSNPLISLSVPNGNFTINKLPLAFSLQASMVDKEFELQDGNIKFGSTSISNMNAKFSFNDWTGKFTTTADIVLMKESVHAPITVTFDKLSEEKTSKMPQSFDIHVSTPGLTGTFIRSTQALWVHITKVNEELFISSSSNIGLEGRVDEEGLLSLSVDNKIPCKFKVSKNTKSRISDLRIYDVDVDLPKALKLINFKMAKLYNGRLKGEISILGPKNFKYFDGNLFIDQPEFCMPDFFTAHAKSDIINLLVERDRIYTELTRFNVKRSLVDVSVDIRFKKTVFDSVVVIVRTANNTYAPVNIDMDQVHVKGNGKLDLEIVVDSDDTVVTGNITAKDTNAEFGKSTLSDFVTSINGGNNENGSSGGIEVNLDIKMEKRVQIFYGSFLRTLVVPDSEITFMYNSMDDRMIFNGDVPVKSGEIVYLNTSFFIKDGRVVFSGADDNFDPYISLTAETKQYDSSNNEVTVSLTVDHQRLSEFSPKLTSSPARSEKEIMEILGNIATGNSDNVGFFMLATGDYALQTMFVRKIENSLRDFFNFDILSLRTMVVQNALKYSVSRSEDSQGMKIGNFLDDTTVYIGKYFGKDLYADALFRLSYQEGHENDLSTWQGLVLKPEIGLEMNAPFANIRWSLASDLSDLARNEIVIIPSLTLSWKFNF